MLELNEDQKLHVAIIMDGNGRWATRQGKSRTAGHQVGAGRIREIVEASAELGIGTLTLFAFSSDNWGRPKFEVNFLMNLLKSYLKSEISRCRENGIKLSIIGRRDRLKPQIVKLIEEAEALTSAGKNLHLRVAIDYSSRDAILQAAQSIQSSSTFSRQEFARQLAIHTNMSEQSPDVDILIRTGGEKRLSDFLLWECAYAEFFFLPVMWPDFSSNHLKDILQEFNTRERRFGRTSGQIFRQKMTVS